MTSLPNIPSNAVSWSCEAPKSLRTQQIFHIVFNANTELKTVPRELEAEAEKEKEEGEKRKTKSAYQFVDLINEQNVIERKIEIWIIIIITITSSADPQRQRACECRQLATVLQFLKFPLCFGFCFSFCFSLLSLFHLSLLNFFRLGNFAWVFRTIFDW